MSVVNRQRRGQLILSNLPHESNLPGSGSTWAGVNVMSRDEVLYPWTTTAYSDWILSDQILAAFYKGSNEHEKVSTHKTSFPSAKVHSL